MAAGLVATVDAHDEHTLDGINGNSSPSHDETSQLAMDGGAGTTARITRVASFTSITYWTHDKAVSETDGLAMGSQEWTRLAGLIHIRE